MGNDVEKDDRAAFAAELLCVLSECTAEFTNGVIRGAASAGNGNNPAKYLSDLRAFLGKVLDSYNGMVYERFMKVVDEALGGDAAGRA